MKTDDLIVLGLAGAAAFIIAKAAGLNLGLTTTRVNGNPNAGSFAQSIWNPINPLAGTSYDPANPGVYIPNSQLINGTIHDYYSGNGSSYYTPMISAITDSVLSGMNGTSGGRQTVIKNPDAWW